MNPNDLETKNRRHAPEKRQARLSVAEQARLIDLTTDAIVVRDLDDRITFWSRGAEATYGFSADEALGRVAPELLRTESVPPWQSLRESLGRDGRWAGELTHRRRDGRTVVVRSRWVLDRDERGEPAAILESNIDVTAEKAAVDSLRRSENHLRLALEASQSYAWSVNLQTGETTFSNNAAEVLGLPPDVKTPEPWEAMHVDDLDRVRADFDRAIADTQEFLAEFRIVRHDGGIRWFESRGKIDREPSGAARRMIGTSTDITARKVADEERQKFVFLADQSAEFIGMSDLEFTPFYINPAGLRMIGLEGPSRPRRVAVLDCFFPEDHPTLLNEFFPAVLRDGQAEIEIRFRHFKTGRPIWVIYTVSLLKDSDGRPIGYATLSRNIDARRQAEAALRESEKRYRAILENESAMVCRFRPDGTILFVNTAYAALRGTTPEALIGANFWNFIPADDRDTVRATLDGLRPAAPEARVENTFESGAGIRWTLWTNRALAFDDEGRATELQSSGLDITDRKIAEQALKESEERFRSIFETTQAGILLISGDGRYVDVNPAVCEMLGRPRDEIVGRRTDEFLAPNMAEILGKARDEFRRTGTWRGEFPLIRPDGTHVILDWNATALPDGSRLAAIIDITDRKRAEDVLLAKSKELEQFAYVASHDLQEPLRKVTSYADLLRQEFGDRLGAEGGRYINTMFQAATRMNTLIRDLLDYSRLDRRERRHERVDLKDVVQGAVDDLERTIAENQVALDVGPLPVVNGDRSKLHQLLQNLLSNAIKFRGERPPRIAIFSEPRDGEWVVGVRDNGIGIETRHLARIFKVFQRLHSQSEIQGTGIGLAICKKIVNQHGGRIWVESTAGEGSTFYFTLPKGERT